jgi:hypothetical protein
MLQVLPDVKEVVEDVIMEKKPYDAIIEDES